MPVKKVFSTFQWCRLSFTNRHAINTQIGHVYMKSKKKTNTINQFLSIEIFAIKAAEKNKENNKKIIMSYFHHNLKNIPFYVMNEVLKRFYYVLFDDGLTCKIFEIGVYRFLNSNSSYVPACVPLRDCWLTAIRPVS